MARTQSKNYPEIREGILKSAAKLFASQGYLNTTIVDLADACNSSRGALYHYFESKEEILAEILETHLETVFNELKSVSEQQHEPTQAFRALMRRLMVLNSLNQAEQVTLLNEMNQLEPQKRSALVEKQRLIIDIIVDALSRLDSKHKLAPINRKLYGMMVLGAINYTYVWYNPEGPVKPEAYADMTVDAFISGFDPDHAGKAEGGSSARPRQTRKEMV